MTKVVIFDCFGVLFSDTFLENYRKFGGDPVADEQWLGELTYRVFVGEINTSTTEIAKRLGISEDQWRTANEVGRDFNHSLLEYIRELKNSGLYKLAVLSNVNSKGLAAYMDIDVLQEIFGENIYESGKIGYAKPDPQAYEFVTDQLGVRLDECVFVDDNQDYVEAARAVGMQALKFEDTQSFRRGLSDLLDKEQ